VLEAKRQFLRYARVETSHLQKQTPYFQHFTRLELNAFSLSTQKNIVLTQILSNKLPTP